MSRCLFVCLFTIRLHTVQSISIKLPRDLLLIQEEVDDPLLSKRTPILHPKDATPFSTNQIAAFCCTLKSNEKHFWAQKIHCARVFKGAEFESYTQSNPCLNQKANMRKYRSAQTTSIRTYEQEYKRMFICGCDMY